MDTGELIYMSLMRILDHSRILEILSVRVIRGESGLWLMLLVIIWVTLIKTTEIMFHSTHLITTTATA